MALAIYDKIWQYALILKMTNDLWIRCAKLGSPVLSHSHDFRNPMVKTPWFPVKDSTEKTDPWIHESSWLEEVQ